MTVAVTHNAGAAEGAYLMRDDAPGLKKPYAKPTLAPAGELSHGYPSYLEAPILGAPVIEARVVVRRAPDAGTYRA